MPLLSSPSFTPHNTEGAVLPLIITGLRSARKSAMHTTLTLSYRKQGVEGWNEEHRFRFKPQNCWSSANGNKWMFFTVQQHNIMCYYFQLNQNSHIHRIHMQPSKRFRVHYPSTHMLTTNQSCTHTLTLSQRYTFSPYTNSHTYLYDKKENTERNHDSPEAGDISEVLHTGWFFHSEKAQKGVFTYLY